MTDSLDQIRSLRLGALSQIQIHLGKEQMPTLWEGEPVTFGGGGG